MGKILATYVVKVTIREVEDAEAPPELAPPGDPSFIPTNEQLAELVKASVEMATALPTTATSTRTDR